MLVALVYRLGEFLLDTRHQKLMRGDQRVGIAKKPYQILVYLAENRHRLVTRQELLEKFWDGLDVYDQTLSRTVARIRSALGDAHFIETRWATGYQYIGPFQVVGEPVAELPQTMQQDGSPDPAPAEPAHPPNRSSQPHFLSSRRFGYRSIPRHALAFASIAALVFCGGLALKRSVLRRARPAIPMPTAIHAVTRKTVAVLTFKNLSGQAKENWLGTALAEIISTDLSADERLRVIPGESVARAIRELNLQAMVGLSPETLAKVSRDLSADFVISGSYTFLDAPQAGRPLIRVDALLQDDHGEVIAAFGDQGRYDDVFDLAAAAKSRLLAALVLPGSAAPDRQNLALASDDPAAVKAYMEGLQLVHSGDLIEATAKLEDAVKLDPSFALAHSCLSDLWAERGFQEKQKEEAALAFHLAAGLDREHVLLFKARYAYAEGDWNTALEAERALFTFAPDNLEYGLELANTQTAAGKPLDADATLRLLRALPKPVSDDPRIDLAAAAAAQSESDAPAAVRFTQNAMDKAEKSGARLLYARALSMQAGNLAGSDLQASIRESDEARRICEQFEDDACVANILRRLGVFLVGTDPQAAAADFNLALVLARKIGSLEEEDNDLNGLAAILSDEDDYAPADKIYRQLLQNAHSENSAWGVQMTLNNLGNDLFMEGKLAEAERIELDALHVAQQIGLKGATAYEELSLSQIRLARGNVLQAGNDAQAALTTWTGLRYDKGRALALSALGAAERFNNSSRKQAAVHLRESIRILEASGLVGSLAQARLELARAELDQGDARGAADLSRSAAGGFASQRSPAGEASALGLLALALESLDDQNTAVEELRRAENLVHSTQARASALDVEFDAAAFQVGSFASDPGSNQNKRRAVAASGSKSSTSPDRSIASIYPTISPAMNSSIDSKETRTSAISLMQRVASEARNSGFILLATRAQQVLDHLDQYALKSETGYPPR